jgi:hypothetical protein
MFSLCRVMRCSKTATKPVTYSETYVIEYQSGRWIVTSDALVQNLVGNAFEGGWSTTR